MIDKRTKALLDWYSANKRDLTWRKTTEEYAVIVSEMMLQQTRVETVIDYYNAFVMRFPDVFALAAADEADVLHAWQGLGYYRRARNLHSMAKAVAENEGVFPATYQGWLELPGVGPYIAGAVMSIAQEQPQPAVDGNVLRVIARLDGSRDDIAQTATRKKTQTRVRELMPPTRLGDFTQSLMELGALICKPTAPLCAVCPVSAFCKAFRMDTYDEIPVKSVKRKPKLVRLWALLVLSGDHVLLCQRPENGLLARMWGVPVVEKTADKPSESQFAQCVGASLENGQDVGAVTHIFTHQRWEMDVVQLCVDAPFDAGETSEWVRFDALEGKAIPTVFKKVLQLVHR